MDISQLPRKMSSRPCSEGLDLNPVAGLHIHIDSVLPRTGARTHPSVPIIITGIVTVCVVVHASIIDTPMVTTGIVLAAEIVVIIVIATMLIV